MLPGSIRSLLRNADAEGGFVEVWRIRLHSCLIRFQLAKVLLRIPTIVIERALAAKRESKSVDFKRSFDVDAPSDWCEIVKDLVAMANSGGGVVIIGAEDNGSAAPAGSASGILALDPARITDKVAKYTSVQFDGFEITEGIRHGQAVGLVVVESALRPLVFDKPGTYPVEDRKQKTAFSAGTLYVRHGAKSEPATSEDVARIIERVLHSQRKEWMSGVRRVVNAPTGSTVAVVPAGVRQSQDPMATPIRITNDLTAPEYRLVDPDTTHPFRQKELVAEVNERLPTGERINQFDIQAVRHLYAVEAEPRYFHKARFATAQYSPEFRDWLVGEFERDGDFFAKTRTELSRRRSGS
jgi:hypothetical protein